MKLKQLNLSTVLLALSLMVFGACISGNDKNNQQDTSNASQVDTTDTTSSTDQADEQTGDKHPIIKSKVRFTGVYTNTRGAIFVFETPDGKRLEFFDCDAKDKEGLKFTHGVAPNQPDPPGFENVWFEIEHQVQPCPVWDGSTGETNMKDMPVLLTIERLKN